LFTSKCETPVVKNYFDNRRLYNLKVISMWNFTRVEKLLIYVSALVDEVEHYYQNGMLTQPLKLPLPQFDLAKVIISIWCCGI
jgi:hypothetical protein